MTTYHPGPSEVPPNQVPDGLLIHIYAVPTDRGPTARLLFERELTLDDAVIKMALDDSERATGMLLGNEDAICVVVYVGDTGLRETQFPADLVGTDHRVITGEDQP